MIAQTKRTIFGSASGRAAVGVVATVLTTIAVIGVSTVAAGASTLTSADGYTTLTTQGTVAAHTPYSSGQTITLAVTANPTMNQAAMEAAGFPGGADVIKFLECADPGGLQSNLPTKSSECEPGSIHTISGANADGSLTTNYIILFLPDPNLGSSNGTDCGLAPKECVVGIFANQNDFTKPHLFSAPFVVSQGDGSDDGANPGDGTSAPSTAPAITSASSTTFTEGSAGT